MNMWFTVKKCMNITSVCVTARISQSKYG